MACMVQVYVSLHWVRFLQCISCLNVCHETSLRVYSLSNGEWLGGVASHPLGPYNYMRSIKATECISPGLRIVLSLSDFSFKTVITLLFSRMSKPWNTNTPCFLQDDTIIIVPPQFLHHQSPITSMYATHTHNQYSQVAKIRSCIPSSTISLCIKHHVHT